MAKQSTSDVKYIDLEKIVCESNSTFLKKLPRIVIKLLAHIVKQKEINYILNKYANDFGTDFLTAVIQEFNINVRVHGIENMPENGRCFFASNHPFGILDGLILTHTISSKYGAVKAIANDAFTFIPQLRPLIAEVNVYGNSTKDAVRALNETYSSSFPISHFPAGEVSRRYHGKIQDSPWQKSFIRKAIASNRNIVPVYISGRNSRLFYSIFMIRKSLGIGTNLELMLLPREMFRCHNKTVDVYIGKPMAPKELTTDISDYDWAQKIRAQAYALAKPNKK